MKFTQVVLPFLYMLYFQTQYIIREVFDSCKQYLFTMFVKRDLSGLNIQSYTLLKQIGSGTFSIVYEAINNDNKQTVAIKAIPTSILKDRQIKQFADTQIHILQTCKGQNIIKLIDIIKTKDDLLLVTEYCEKTLGQYRRSKERMRITQNEAISYLKQILNGLSVLNSHSIVHRDLKEQNILIKNGVIKIADFGVSKILKEMNVTNTFVGTLNIMAPQIMNGQEYGQSVDIYSAGAVFYQMMYGRTPFKGSSEMEIHKNTKQFNISFNAVNITDLAKDFITKCLAYKTTQRLTLSQALKHPLICQRQEKSYTVHSINKIQYNERVKERFVVQNKLSRISEQSYTTISKMELQLKNKQNEIIKLRLKCFEQFERTYMRRRNSIFFVFKNICMNREKVHSVTKHVNFIFIIAKHGYLQMATFRSDIKNKKNIFNLSENYFKQFCKQPQYKKLVEIVQDDNILLQYQLEQYQKLIQSSSSTNIEQSVRLEIDYTKFNCEDWREFCISKVKQYQIMLIEILQQADRKYRYNLIKAVESLHYLSQNFQTVDDEEFDIYLESHDNSHIQKLIQERYNKYLVEKYK